MPIQEANLGDVALRPQAQILDTYVRPSMPRGGGLRLAAALQAIQPSITHYLQKNQQETDEAATAQARKDALSEAQQDIKDVTSGAKFAQSSKLYRKAYLQQRGLIEGQRIRAEGIKAYQEAGLENSTDPAEFDKFFSGFVKDKLDGITDPDMLHGALGVVEQSANNLSLQNAAKVSENIQSGIMEDAVTLVGSSIDNELEAAVRENRAVNLDTVMQSVNASNARTRFLQLDGVAFRKKVTDLVVDKALRYADPSVLTLLDKQMDANGKKIPLADGYWKSIKDEALTRVESRRFQLADQIAQQEERTRKENLRVGQTAVLKLFSDNPYAMPTTQQLMQWEAYAPGLGEQAMSIRSKLIEAREKTSPAQTVSVMRDFAQDPSNFDKLLEAAKRGVDPSVIRWGLTTYERATNAANGGGWRAIQNNPAVAPYMAKFDNAASDPVMKMLTDSGDLADAKQDFNLALVDYFAQNPDATYTDTAKFVRTTFREITERTKATSLNAHPQPPQPKPQAPTRAKQAAPAEPEQGNPFDQFPDQ